MRHLTRERLRYLVDEFFARGTVALILGLFAISALIIVVIALVVAVTGADSEGRPVPELLWMGLLRTLDPGTMGGDQGTPGFLLGMLGVTFGGIFVVAALIGILNAGIEGRLSELRKGRSRVVESGHTVILGWSQQVFAVLAELVAANANQRRSVVVVLADQDKVAMEDEIRVRLPTSGRTKIVCRSGSPVDLDEIDIANVQASRAVIVLAPDAPDPDVEVIKTLLAITNDPNRRPEPYHVVAEIRDAANLQAARLVGGDEVELVQVGEIVARVIAQTCRQAGLSIVYTELLDFAGDEIYFATLPELVGMPFGKVLCAFEESSVIGLARPDGTTTLDPPMDTRIAPGDRVIAISTDDDTIRLRTGDAPAIDQDAIVDGPARPATPEATLLLGWNLRARAIAHELDAYVAPGSRLTVVTDDPAAAEPAVDLRVELRNHDVRFVPRSPSDRTVLDKLDIASYDHVIVLSPVDRLDAQRADAHTLVTLLHLRDIASTLDRRFSIVSEMADVRNRSLAEVTRADDFIVSDRLTSLILAQIAENKQLHAVFADLFDAEGAEIYLRPAADYVLTGREVSYATVVEAARRRGELALGYRLRSAASDAARSYGVRVNPPKSGRVTLAEGDRIIVLAQG